MTMLTVERILGDRDEPRFRGRRVECLGVDSADAAKRILRRTTEAGTDVAIALPRGSYLADGAVLADDGERIVVVARRPEPALLVSFSPELDRPGLLAAAVRIGHAFGNQHVPVEIDGDEIRVPITTSAQIALETIERLGLPGVLTELADVPLARRSPMPIGHRH
ncbi:MAG TPA: urease accessory protein UreE [Solirubrobacteraceae bacterium]|jgi:urease accessory protein